MKSISLTGFMGTGKTTTANLLKEHYDFNKIFSIDQEIEKSNNLTIKDIFKIYGEPYFRELEYNSIFNIISNNNDYILDLGGGAFIQDKNRDLLKNNNIITIFLNVSFNAICKRLENQNTVRPLLSENNWQEKAKNLFNSRYEIYRQADIIIDILDEYSQEKVAKLVNEKINK